MRSASGLGHLAPWLLFAITLAGGGLRVLGIGGNDLWLDEAFSVWASSQPLVGLWDWLARVDQHPPLYYALLHVWRVFGQSEAAVRSLSALAGALAIPAIYLLGRRLGGRSTGLYAALILALSPFHVRYGQEARMYTLLALNVTLASLCLVLLVAAPRIKTEAGALDRAPDRAVRFSWLMAPLMAWLGYVVFTAAALLTHHTAFFFVAAANLLVLGSTVLRRLRAHRQAGRSRAAQSGQAPAAPAQAAPGAPDAGSAVCWQLPRLTPWLLAQTGVLLLWLPWSVPSVRQAAGVYRRFWLPYPTFQDVADAVGRFLSDFLPLKMPWSLAVWAGYGLLFLLGAAGWRLCRTPWPCGGSANAGGQRWTGGFRRLIASIGRPARASKLVRSVFVGPGDGRCRGGCPDAVLWLMFAAPILGELLVSTVRPIFYDRTLIWATIPLYLLLAVALGRLRWPYVLAALALIVTANGLSLASYYQTYTKEQWRAAAHHVAARVEPDDLILFSGAAVQLPFDYYFRPLKREVDERGAPADVFDHDRLEPEMTEGDLPALRALIRERRRVWLVHSHSWYTDPEGLVPALLAGELSLLDRQMFTGLEVRLYGAP